MASVGDQPASAGVLHEFRDHLLTIEDAWEGLPAEDRDAAVKALDAFVVRLRGGPATLAPQAQEMRWRRRSTLIGIVSIILWTVTFSVGIVVPTGPFRAVLGNLYSSPVSVLEFVMAGSVVLVCSTFSNPAILACTAALIGSVAHEVTVRPQAANEVRNHLAAIFQGFFVYLGMMSGLMLLTTEAILNATQLQYVQIAAVMSIVAYLVGYDSTLFQKLVKRIGGLAQSRGVIEEREREEVTAFARSKETITADRGP
jgi:hypothetical protein